MKRRTVLKRAAAAGTTIGLAASTATACYDPDEDPDCVLDDCSDPCPSKCCACVC